MVTYLNTSLSAHLLRGLVPIGLNHSVGGRLLKGHLARLAIEEAQRSFTEVLGIRRGFMLTYRKRAMPLPADVLRYGERWRPFRSVASWYLWRSVDLHRRQAMVLPG